MKDRRAGEFVDFAVGSLDESRLLRAGMLQMAGDVGPSRRMAQKLFERTDAKADAHCDWLLDLTARSRAGFKKLLHGWHDAAALAAVDSWPLGRYDLVRHPEAIIKVDLALAELARRFPERYALLQTACEAADLSPLLYAALAPGTRSDAARHAVTTSPARHRRKPPESEPRT